MATGERVDPYRNFNFLVEIDGITQAGFSDCTGFGASTDPIEYREGNENPGTDPKTVRKLPGMTKYNDITLKWGLTDSRELYDWYRDVSQGKDLTQNKLRKSGSIVVLDLEGQEKQRWNFKNAWPSKWDGPEFTAKGNDVAIQTLTLAHEGIELA
jgi:phage tail-like protein